MNILFTCGGTAGHVNPAVALARIFQDKHPGCRVLFVGADGGMETRLVPKEGYPIRTVTITNFHRSLAPADIVHNLGTLVNMQRSKKQARAILDEATDNWGIKVNRVELKNIIPPKEIQNAMEKQMKAERERRESILQAEGQKQSQILVAEGEKQSAILRADAA